MFDIVLTIRLEFDSFARSMVGLRGFTEYHLLDALSLVCEIAADLGFDSSLPSFKDVLWLTSIMSVELPRYIIFRARRATWLRRVIRRKSRDICRDYCWKSKIAGS